jgi:predicted dehydrogenase
LAAGTARPGYAAESNTIKVALVGCGGRGGGAAGQALSTAGPVKLWAVADVFENKVGATLEGLRAGHGSKIDVPAERQFTGFDGYKKAIDSLSRGDVVLLATPPAFRPLHFEYAVEKGVHVFAEKSFGVDAPGVRRMLKAGEEAARKNLKVAGGLMSRHSLALTEAVEKIHGGMIGDVITAYAYRMHGPVGFAAKRSDATEMAHQIANYSCFTWLNGSFIVDWLIHNIDVCCWILGGWPVSVQGMGGRQVRSDADQLFDHYMAEYTFANGSRMIAQGRHIAKCHDFFGDIIHGTTGSAVLGEGQPKPRLFKGRNQTSANMIWSYQGEAKDQYQHEHDLLFDAIRQDKPYNEMERCAKACMAAIMGRMACESGKEIRWEDAMASNLQLAPGIEEFTMSTTPPAAPGQDGRYPIAMPGQTQAC